LSFAEIFYAFLAEAQKRKKAKEAAEREAAS
jgi:hypothetical protein